MAYIYKISNDINNKVYIGKTTHSIEDRYKDHWYDSTRPEYQYRPLYRAFNKYGAEHFSVSMLEECPEKISSEREIYWIKYYDSYGNGYNATLGGEGRLSLNKELVISIYQNTNSINQTAEKLNCNRTTVSKILHENDIPIFEHYRREGGKKTGNPIKMIQNDIVVKTFVNQCEAARWIIEHNLTSNRNIRSIASNISKVIHKQRNSYLGYKWESR